MMTRTNSNPLPPASRPHRILREIPSYKNESTDSNGASGSRKLIRLSLKLNKNPPDAKKILSTTTNRYKQHPQNDETPTGQSINDFFVAISNPKLMDE